MIVYNVTVKVETDSVDPWLKWMQEEHIPDVLETGYFESARMSRLISVGEQDGSTFSIQYTCASMKVFHQYQIQAAPQLQKEHQEKFGEKALAFRSMMEVIQDYSSSAK